ncbi:MAG TPA: CDP-diacylglycerol--glycerol-3-phosphate 3-phosphatidyltransferase [Candidatus Hydrogenedentes bacterium]|nr:CDP-diacylglycerol--glycerol-3-phosphate 3-phosphatidyltransferase [Candidatus Hydrogenedentota bacterium]HPG68542.1 CDP-diacylglycerol--glycerol-3-phosphate 3-phosphatidyltransferase [Candidatus Hydrogenedentota bacterium]
MNLPNQLTLARVIIALVYVVLMSFSSLVCEVIALTLFLVALVTDYYDGRIARSRNLITNFGKLLDPVADKVLVVAALIMLMENRYLDIPAWTIVLILGREFLVTGARLLAASNGVVIAANKYGKAKTGLQMGYAFGALLLAIVVRQLDTIGGIAQRFPRAVAFSKDALLSVSFWAIVLIALYTAYSGAQILHANWDALDIRKT